MLRMKRVINMTKIIAHRGANKYAPQNTVPAFKKALELGCDGFENDVHLATRYSNPICLKMRTSRTFRRFSP